MIHGELELETVEAVAQEERRQLVERVLSSDALSRSERLCELLRFVCDRALSGRSGEINEQHVGEAVFGRRKDYDSSIDGIVRTQASRLRQRLSLYFENEGRNETMVIVVPRGSYVPVFERRQKIDVATPEEQPAIELKRVTPDVHEPIMPRVVVPGIAVREKRPPSILLPWIVAGILACCCAFLANYRVHQTVPPTASKSDPFWSKLFGAGQSTLLVPGDSSLVNYERITHRSVGLGEYVSGDYRVVRTEEHNQLQNVAAAMANPRYTSVVDLEIAQALSLIAREQHGNLELRHPREARPNDFKQGNLILVGSSEATPWVSLFEPDMNFVFDYQRTPENVNMSVLNRQPQANEPPRWTSDRSNPQHPVYAVVAYLPNLNRTGNVLILEGISMAGTECAWDFVSDQGKLNNFLQTIRRPDGRIPYFEVVLGTNNINGSAGEVSILATRVREPSTS
jgi:hypothetical protein